MGRLVFLGESASLRMVLSAILILGGVGVTLIPRERTGRLLP